MADFLNEISFFEGETSNILKRHFPQVNRGKHGIRIAWLLQLAEMSMKPLSDSMGMIETEERLADVTVLRVNDEEGNIQLISLTDTDAIKALDEEVRKEAIIAASKKLVQLDQRCFPIYRPMLYSYGLVFNGISQGEIDSVTPMIKNLAEDRTLRKNAALRARDYMDWYMLQSADEVVGKFSEKPKANSTKPFGQKLPTERYLDLLESVYE